MYEFAMCVKSVSLLPLLDPLAGAALAINLAYLNLERFRYRKQIRAHIQDLLRELIDGDRGRGAQRLKDMEDYKQLEYLAELPDNDPQKRDLKTIPKKEKWPPNIWGKIYVVYFSHHQDRNLCYAFTAISTLAFVLGVAHSIGYLSFSFCYFSNDNILYFYYALSVAMIVPMLSVMAGAWVVRSANKFASHNVGELTKVLQAMVSEAQVKHPDATGISRR